MSVDVKKLSESGVEERADAYVFSIQAELPEFVLDLAGIEIDEINAALAKAYLSGHKSRDVEVAEITKWKDAFMEQCEGETAINERWQKLNYELQSKLADWERMYASTAPHVLPGITDTPDALRKHFAEREREVENYKRSHDRVEKYLKDQPNHGTDVIAAAKEWTAEAEALIGKLARAIESQVVKSAPFYTYSEAIDEALAALDEWRRKNGS